MRCPYEGDSLLGSGLDVLVELLGVATDARVRIDVLSVEGMLVEVTISILKCFLCGLIEDPDLISVKYGNIATLEMVWQVTIGIKAPIIILEITKALAQASTFQHVLFFAILLLLATLAALLTVWIGLGLRVGQFVLCRLLTQ